MIIRGGLFSACIAENDPLRFLRETYVLMKKMKRSPGILPRGIYPLHIFYKSGAQDQKVRYNG